jgi:branched-chain amino acid aminotransferase
MALFPTNNYFVFNKEIRHVKKFVPSENEGGIYEVLRVTRGIPLFFEDHMTRFYNSAAIAGKTIRFAPEEIKNLIYELIQTNEENEGNILLSCKTNLKAFFIPYRYPSEIQYREGVNCRILKAERENPNAKVFQTEVRRKANEMIDNNGIFEVLLEDHLGGITEGSRSNVFFVKGDVLITPPFNKVLPGITRQKTMLCAKELQLEIFEKDVFRKDLPGFDSVFITGTSPKILPVKTIESFSYNTENKILRSLMKSFDLMIDRYTKKISD